jgi:hypothetical protein
VLPEFTIVARMAIVLGFEVVQSLMLVIRGELTSTRLQPAPVDNPAKQTKDMIIDFDFKKRMGPPNQVGDYS